VTSKPIFHLSFPVRSLADSLAFYERCLGASRGRAGEGWRDVIVFGHQLTLHELPAQVLPREQHGVRHFGAILDVDAFESMCARIATLDPPVAHRVLRRDPGLASEHAKLLLDDPDGNLLEIKSYRDPATVFVDASS